jgi:ankyrin repeat protein
VALGLGLVGLLGHAQAPDAGVKRVDPWQQQRLFHAVCAGNMAQAKELLDAGVAPEFLGQRFEEQPLTAAVWGGNVELVKLLLDRGAQVNTFHVSHSAEMEEAIRRGHGPVVLLLRERLQPSLQPADGFEAARFGIYFSNAPRDAQDGTLWHDVRDKYRQSPLHTLAAMGYRALMEQAFAGGAPVEPTDRWGNTPLMLAASNGHLDVVRLLLEKRPKVRVNARARDDGMTPLLRAAVGCSSFVSRQCQRMCHPEVIRTLVEAGADVKVKDTLRGRTALHYVVEQGDLELVRLLLEKGASLKAKDARGLTPREVAEQSRSSTMAEWLKKAEQEPRPSR